MCSTLGVDLRPDGALTCAVLCSGPVDFMERNRKAVSTGRDACSKSERALLNKAEIMSGTWSPPPPPRVLLGP